MELGALVAEAVPGLQDQDLEHQPMLEGWPATQGVIRAGHRPLEFGPEQLEVDRRAQPLEAVAFRRPPGQPLLEVEESSLPAHPILPASERGNPIGPGKARFFRDLRLSRAASRR